LRDNASNIRRSISNSASQWGRNHAGKFEQRRVRIIAFAFAVAVFVFAVVRTLMTPG